MLTRAAALGVTVVLSVAGCAGCADGGDDGDDDDPATALADRVSAILEAESSAVIERLAEAGAGIDADALADAEVVCPAVDEPAPGDRATCRVSAAGAELELDVEFQDGGAIEVVALAVAP